MSLLMNQSWASPNDPLYPVAGEFVASVAAGPSIGVATTNGVATITNTGVRSLAAGTNCTVTGTNGVLTVSSTGAVSSIVAGSGIAVSSATGNVTISNDAPSDIWPLSTGMSFTSTSAVPQSVATRTWTKSYHYCEGYGFLFSTSGTFGSSPTITVYLSAAGGALDTTKSTRYILQPSTWAVTNLNGYFYDLSQIAYYDPAGFTSLTLTWLSTTGGNTVTLSPGIQTATITNSTTATSFTRAQTAVAGASGFRLFTV